MDSLVQDTVVGKKLPDSTSQNVHKGIEYYTTYMRRQSHAFQADKSNINTKTVTQFTQGQGVGKSIDLVEYGIYTMWHYGTPN